MRRLAVWLALVAAASLLAAGSAAAADVVRSGPWFGQYQVDVGSVHQDDSWTYDHAGSGECDPSSRGSGQETVDWAGGSATVNATGVATPGHRDAPSPSFAVTLGWVPSLTTRATVTRSGQFTSDDEPAGCAVGDGDGGGGPPPGSDCGTRSSAYDFQLLPDGASALKLDDGPGALVESPFQNCPLLGIGFPGMLAVSLPVHAPSFGPGLPAATLTGHAVEPITEPDTQGRTTADARIRLTPLAIVPALVFASKARTVPVDRRGNASVAVSCSSLGRCAGKLSLGVGGYATQPAKVVAADAAPRYPAPILQGEVRIGSRRFALRRGRHGKIRLRLPSGKRSYVNALSQVDMDVIVLVGKGKRASGYAIALVHVKPRR